MQKIISWWQTWADMAGIDFAISNGIDFWGNIPKWWRQLSSTGSEFDNKEYFLRYPWKFNEMLSSSYPPRTRKNVEDSDFTLIISNNKNSGGTRLTVRLCEELWKPYMIISPVELKESDLGKIQSEIGKYDIINIAGNSEYSSPGIYTHSLNVLRKIFL